MCRLAVYMGPPIRLAALLSRHEHSLVAQAQHSLEGAESVNGDGWGVAWYRPELSSRPELFKDVTPAWRSTRLPEIAQGPRSGCILAHVRAATGALSVEQVNCHPFTWGDLSFMHNGAIEEFERLRPSLVESLSLRARRAVRGTTDSELLFALLTDHWLRLHGTRPLQRLAKATRRTIAQLNGLRGVCGIGEPSFLNFAVSDGCRTVVSRATAGSGAEPRSLYLLEGRRVPGGPGTSGIEEPYVVVASEPLEAAWSWQPVAANSLVLIDEARRVTTSRVRLSSSGQRVA